MKILDPITEQAHLVFNQCCIENNKIFKSENVVERDDKKEVLENEEFNLFLVFNLDVDKCRCYGYNY